MKNSYILALIVGASLLLPGCPANKGPHGPHSRSEVLSEYRSTKEWNLSKTAFKNIMRHYVHGEASNIGDAELDADFETYVTLSRQDVEDFIKTQSCVATKSTAEAKYYSVNTMHQRHDAFVQLPDSPHPVVGSGTKHAHAAFSANMLMERYEISSTEPLPARARMEGAHFPDWQALSEIMTSEEKFKALFNFAEPDQADAVFAVASALNWNSDVKGQVFVAPTLHGGAVFSPALFSTYLFRKDAESKDSIFLIISADAQGNPETPYAGLIEDGDAMYKSTTGFSFTYLSTSKNLLNYRFIRGTESPLQFDLRITTAYPSHPESPYLTVNSKFLPIAPDKRVEKYLNSPTTKVISMVRKGALMRDLVATYYPNQKDAQLWNEIGAIKKSRGFKSKLEAAGLNIAVDLFAKHIWLEEPEVGSNKPIKYREIKQSTCF